MDLKELNGGSDEIKILIAGDEITVMKNEKVKEKLKTLLRERGIDSFTILVDGEEITDTDDLPETFGDNEIEVQRYTKPGC